MALPRKVALAVHLALLLLALAAAVFGLNLLLVYAVYFGHFLFTVALLCGLLDRCLPDRCLPDAEESAAPLHLVVQEVPSPATSSPPQRLDYLDNLKVALTAAVVTFHTVCSFSGGGFYFCIGNYPNRFRDFCMALREVLQSFFMVIFFFISAYFTPSSLARKGLRGFLVDKHRRLGIPVLVYTLVLHPLLVTCMILMFWHALVFSYAPSPSHTWFVLWLLMFNEAFSTMRSAERPLQLKLPSLLVLALAGFLIGILQGVCCLLAGRDDGNLLMMPLGIGSLPFDVVAFALGCCAKPNGWLSELGQRGDYRPVVLGMLSSILVAGNFALSFACGGDVFKTLISGRSGYALALAYAGIAGVETVVFCATCLVFFQRSLNCTTPATVFLSGAAYTVYIIHPYVVVPVVWSAVRILNAAQDQRVELDKDSFSSSTQVGPGYLAVACMYSVLLSLLIVWPLSSLLRRLPGCRGIL